MGKKNWIEFDNQEKKSEEAAKLDTFNKRSKINISKQKKGKKGKTVTLIRGLDTEDEIFLKELLKNFFGFPDFKDLQEEAIKSLLSKKDTFVVMPTGGGKSMCYQLPALILDGVSIVVSPLIALMKHTIHNQT